MHNSAAWSTSTGLIVDMFVVLLKINLPQVLLGLMDSVDRLWALTKLIAIPDGNRQRDKVISIARSVTKNCRYSSL